jgi:hypothetical protein
MPQAADIAAGVVPVEGKQGSDTRGKREQDGKAVARDHVPRVRAVEQQHECWSKRSNSPDPPLGEDEEETSEEKHGASGEHAERHVAGPESVKYCRVDDPRGEDQVPVVGLDCVA